MDISNLATQIGNLIGLQPSTLVLFLFILTTAANVGARLIPNDATGALGVLRKICTIVGVYVSSRVSSGVTVNDVAKAAIETPVISAKVDAPTVPDKFDDIFAALKDPQSDLSRAINRATQK